MSADERILGRDGVRQHPDDCEVGPAQAAVQPAVLHYCTSVIAECQQDVIVKLSEAPGTVGAHHHAREVVVHEHRHGDQGVDLPVGGGASSARLVLTHYL